jgi:hypothetical protein
MKKWIFLAVGLGVFFSSAQVAEGKGSATSSVVKPTWNLRPYTWSEFTFPKGSVLCSEEESKRLYGLFKTALYDFVFFGGACYKIPINKYTPNIFRNYFNERNRATNEKIWDMVVGDEVLIFSDTKDFFLRKSYQPVVFSFYVGKTEANYRIIVSMGGAFVDGERYNRSILPNRFKEMKW